MFLQKILVSLVLLGATIAQAQVPGQEPREVLHCGSENNIVRITLLSNRQAKLVDNYLWGTMQCQGSLNTKMLCKGIWGWNPSTEVAMAIIQKAEYPVNLITAKLKRHTIYGGKTISMACQRLRN